MSVEITKAQQVSEEMISADLELLDEELDAVAGGTNNIGTQVGSQGDYSYNSATFGNISFGVSGYNVYPPAPTHKAV